MNLVIALALFGSVGSFGAFGSVESVEPADSVDPVDPVEYGLVAAEDDAYAECKEGADAAAESDTEGGDDGCTGGGCQCKADAGGPGLSLLFGVVLAGVRERRRA